MATLGTARPPRPATLGPTTPVARPRPHPTVPLGGATAHPWPHPHERGRPTRRVGAIPPIHAAVSSAGAESSAISIKPAAIIWGLGGGASGAMICGIGFSPEGSPWPATRVSGEGGARGSV
jgi:hypothetical protein